MPRRELRNFDDGWQLGNRLRVGRPPPWGAGACQLRMNPLRGSMTPMLKMPCASAISRCASRCIFEDARRHGTDVPRVRDAGPAAGMPCGGRGL